jgi:hypothetical protein
MSGRSPRTARARATTESTSTWSRPTPTAGAGPIAASRGAGTDTAATWLEWGALIAELYHRDPDALIAYYGTPEDFIRSTRRGPSNVKADDIPATVDAWRTLYVRTPVAA